VNAGALVLGVLNGLTIGLLAVGLVLVYKSNKFLNLAHAQLGTLSALLLAKFVLDWHWNWGIAFVLVVALGLGTGVAVERVFIDRLRRRSGSPIRLLLLSIGISQLLLALTYIPDFLPDPTKPIVYPQPFHVHLRVGGVALSGMNVLTGILVPLLVAALALFMRYSSMGKQIRAAANNPDAARLCGISVGKVSAITWALAGTFSAVSAVMQGPTQSNFNVASFGPNLLMLTLGAAAFGAFVSLPMALIGGLVLGLAYQIVADITSNGGLAQVWVFGIIMLVVFLRGNAIGRVFATTGSVVEERPILRIPESLRNRAFVRYHMVWLSVAALVAAVVWPQLGYFNTSGNRFLLTLVLIYALVGVSLTMLVGWGGQVSLGHFAILGVGAYLTGRWSDDLSMTALLLAVGVVGALVSVLVGLPALRIRGLTLAVTTLGFAVIASEWLYLQPWLGTKQPFGVTVEPAHLGGGLGGPQTEVDVYYVALVVLVLAVATAAALRRSSPGRVMVAVRDNERASAAFGISPATVKLAVLAVSGFFCAAAGVLWGHAWNSVSPTHFSANVSVAILAIPVIGGLGSVSGAVLAATLLYGFTYFLGPHFQALFGNVGQNLGFSLALAGAGVVSTILWLPTGLAGAAQSRWQAYLDARGARELKAVTSGDPELPLVVEGVHVNFGGVVALENPDIVVHPGEIVGLIGTNGAGKTTLMNVISGVIRPQRGSVKVFGHEVIELAPDYRAAFGLSRSFQDATLFAGLTVRETIQVAASRRHKVGILSAMLSAPWVRRSERRTRQMADEIIERFGLGNWADARTSDLSTGTRRICDLAAQVAARPKVILLDEPTAGVAQREAEAFGPILRQIRDELDCAVLIVEHDMPLLMGLCDRIYALETGSVIAEGTADEIRNDPAVVASYLGTEEAAVNRSGRKAAKRTRARRTPIAAAKGAE
jgi:ABC-type branched-subunit amino acid transport system ATPase component/ABC-type branched-subunit amino acid transport system permease subunit